MIKKFQIWLVAWVELIESIITIFTLGYVDPDWSFNLVFFFALRESKRRAPLDNPDLICPD